MALLDVFPIWAVYIGTVVAVLLAAEIGFRIGMWAKRRDHASKKPAMAGAVVGGMLGLMAFLLAFCIGIVINQHNGRKAMVVTEANAVGTAYLRAGFLNESDQSLTRDLLKEYVEIRLATASDPSLFESTLTRSEEIHVQLWSIIEEIANSEGLIEARMQDSGFSQLRAVCTAGYRPPWYRSSVLRPIPLGQNRFLERGIGQCRGGCPSWGAYKIAKKNDQDTQ